MAQNPSLSANAGDAFSPIADYYDAIMNHVDYARWRYVAASLAEMLPRPFLHLDAGCGTGVLLEILRDSGWDSTGVDISPTMLRVAKQKHGLTALAQADVCALPFQEKFHLITCLFDSLNFLLREDLVCQALKSFEQALLPGGILYFDIVTRQMITDHFDNESWTENHSRFKSFWKSAYDRTNRICETRVRINSGEESITYERVYPSEFIADTVAQSGLTLLAMRDAYTWKKPGRRATRLDFVAVRGSGRDVIRSFQKVEKNILSGVPCPKS
jgi:SAM-dependent methyltransferase